MATTVLKRRIDQIEANKETIADKILQEALITLDNEDLKNNVD